MVAVKEKTSRSLCDPAAVLMARIVDDAGKPIRRRDVAAVVFSVRPVGRRQRGRRAAVPESDPVALNVGEVVFDSLQTPQRWTVDDVGYNFRHEIDRAFFAELSQDCAACELRYSFHSKRGVKSIVRFRIRNR